MTDALELGRMLHDTPDLFPWVVFAVVLILLFKERVTVRKYVDARVDFWTSRKQSDAVMAELIRNNTAALENNTAALESVKQDRGETRRMLQFHENSSLERMTHIQEVVNRIDRTVTENSRQIGLIEYRSDNRR